ncbi:MAG: reverse transcriptase N-terminal domain-containing protein [Microcoleus anatoxicus]
MSVRQITQTNQGKQTAGIDKEVINSPLQRVEFVNRLPILLPTSNYHRFLWC